MMCLASGPVKNGLASFPSFPSLPYVSRRGRGASTTSSRGMTSETPWEGKCARLPPSGFSQAPPSRTGTMSVMRTCWEARPWTVIIQSASPASTTSRPSRQGCPEAICSRSLPSSAPSASRTT
ncbi:hypothetical protein ID875_15135 [Streptomyces globisporus]|uniref:Uncharacterized protein n=1 Tax=Streptomyces globisporus TaxID=1908 RepID=A0A927GNB7_STRGL|nr:hypothetical protein [Streptomyces globisporus]